MLGDHHLWRKGFAYEGSTHIPLLIYGRRMDYKKGVSDSVSCLEDVAATILDMGGVETLPKMYGKSLLPCMEDATYKARDTLLGEFHNPYNYYFLIKDDLKYIYYHKKGEEQLFDLKNDPLETNDISSSEETLVKMRKELLSQLKSRGQSTEGLVFNPLKNSMPLEVLRK